MYKCLVIDDEKLARRLIENHLAQLDEFEVIASCKSAIEASAILKDQSIDLLFLDIEMPVLNGTAFYKNLITKPQVIFTTAYRDYAVDGFDLNAVDYLVKPITFPRFFQAIEKFRATQSTHTPTTSTTPIPTTKNYIFITEDRKQVKITLDDILYIESLKNYIKICTAGRTHLVKHSLSAFADLLDSHFIRVHRSYIVNSPKVTAFTKQDIEIGDIEIPIGESYKGALDMLKK